MTENTPPLSTQNPYSHENATHDRYPDTINLLDYIEVLIKHRSKLLKFTTIVFILAIIIAFTLPPYYSSTARILPPQQDNGLMGMMMATMGTGMSNIASDILGNGTSADLYVGILNSETIKDSVIDKFNLQNVYNEKYRVDAYNTLNKYVDITSGKKDGIISITVLDKNPRRAAEMANFYVDELSKLVAHLNITDATLNKGFLEKRLAEAKTDLANSEEKLRLFQSKNKMLDVSDQAKATIEGIAILRAQLSSLELQLATLSRQFTDSSQEVKTTKSSINNLKAQISKMEGTGAGGVIPNIGSVPSLGEQYLKIMREYKIQEAIVELLTKQYEMADLSESKDVVSIQVLQKARISDKKSKPKRILIIISSTMISLILTILFVFLLETLDRMSEENRQRWNNILSSLHIPTRFQRRA